MAEKVTIQDVADMVNVSKSSVSRYLNGGYVSKENAEKIKKTIEKTGFQTNFFAKRLKTKRSRLIGIVLPRMDSVTVGKMLTGMHRRLESGGYQGMILSSELDLAKELSNISSLRQQGVDGVIVNSMAITKRHFQLTQSLGVPLLFVGQECKSMNYVKVDDEAAGKMMGQYIKEKGHRNIVFLGVNERDKAVGIERKRGFIETVQKDNPECKVDFVETGFSFQEAWEKGEEVLKYQPTAIVCATDNISLGILRYLHERGIKVPNEVSVAGFGGYDIGAVSYPALTTVFFDYEAIGAEAAEQILGLIEEKPLRTSRQLNLTFIERESVCSI